MKTKTSYNPSLHHLCWSLISPLFLHCYSPKKGEKILGYFCFMSIFISSEACIRCKEETFKKQTPINQIVIIFYYF